MARSTRKGPACLPQITTEPIVGEAAPGALGQDLVLDSAVPHSDPAEVLSTPFCTFILGAGKGWLVLGPAEAWARGSPTGRRRRWRAGPTSALQALPFVLRYPHAVTSL